ncbi:MAG: macro domain-containing protein [Clostridiales bacterium]|nr:macro domain-containing protein [Clostridiales bacterium]
MPFSIISGDITEADVDVIVNAANTRLLMGGGVCGAVFRAAGISELTEACEKTAPVETGKAVITPGFRLKAKYIIHTPGPIYGEQSAGESERLLRSSYTESLSLAKEYGCESIAFPLISSGIYGYPRAEALSVAVDAVRDFLKDNEMDVYLVIFNRNDIDLRRGLELSVERYIRNNCVEIKEAPRASFMPLFNMPEASAAPRKKGLFSADRGAKSKKAEESVDLSRSENAVFSEEPCAGSVRPSVDGLLSNLDEPFSDILLKLIDKKGKTDVEVYKRANIDRKLFSKIRTGKGYMPGKRTILALAVSLELDIDETADLLKCGGYALSHSRRFDVIVEYFIVNGMYDIFEINETLFKFDEPLLGG